MPLFDSRPLPRLAARAALALAALLGAGPALAQPALRLVDPVVIVDEVRVDRRGLVVEQPSFRFLTLALPGQGTFVVSDRAFSGARRAGDFNNERLAFAVDGRSVRVRGAGPILSTEGPVPAYVRFDRDLSGRAVSPTALQFAAISTAPPPEAVAGASEERARAPRRRTDAPRADAPRADAPRADAPRGRGGAPTAERRAAPSTEPRRRAGRQAERRTEGRAPGTPAAPAGDDADRAATRAALRGEVARLRDEVVRLEEELHTLRVERERYRAEALRARAEADSLRRGTRLSTTEAARAAGRSAADVEALRAEVDRLSADVEALRAERDRLRSTPPPERHAAPPGAPTPPTPAPDGPREGAVRRGDGPSVALLNFDYGRLRNPTAVRELVAEASYPEPALLARTQGDVLVLFVTEPSGAVVQTEVMRPLGGGLDELAEQLVRAMRFVPPTVDGQAAALRSQVIVRFTR